jgi:N-acetylglucosaminyl-diphospho-decaprenol L-rhamnosyltransferase
MNSAPVDVSAIIISLNSRRFLADCLASLANADWRGYTYEIIVVDNGSTDGTVEMMRRDHPEIRLVANQGNVGYCKAGNQGADVARGRYFLFLNDDILIIGDALAQIVQFMDSTPDCGMAGSRLLNLDGSDQFSSGRAFTTPMNALFSRKSPLTAWFPNAPWAKQYLLSDRITGHDPYEVDWLSAAAAMARREAFEASGKLVEDFYYFHEQIICARMQKAGYRIHLLPQSKIIHYEGAGSGHRTRRVLRLHVEKFHKAAYKWYCLHHEIGPRNPLRLLVAGLLTARAVCCVAWEMVKVERPQTETEVGRPEGGIPL